MSDSLPHLFTPRLVLKPLQKDQAELLSALANEPLYEDVSMFGVLREHWCNPVNACEYRV